MASSSTLAIRPLTNALADSLEALRRLSSQTSIPILALDDTPPSPEHEGDDVLELSPSIAHAGRMLIALKAQLDEAFIAMTVHRARVANAKTAISSLPPEVLAMIFHHVRLSTPYGHYESDFAPRMDVVFLPTHVCHQWRAICRGLSSYWTWLTISGEHQSDMLESLLPLSGKRLVTLSLRGLVYCPTGCIRLPKSGHERIVEVRVRTHEELEAFDVPPGAKFDRLHTIYADGVQNTAGSWAPLGMGYGKGAVPLAGVQSLTIRRPADLGRCRALRYLALGSLDAKQCMYLLRSLPSGSRLQHLKLTWMDPDDQSAQARHENELTRPLDHLRTLTLAAGIPPSLARYLHGCCPRNLETLVLSDLFAADGGIDVFRPLMSAGQIRTLELSCAHNWTKILSLLLSSLDDHDPTGASDGTLLPHLSHLTLTTSQGYYGDEGNVEKAYDQLILLLDGRRECGLPDLTELVVDAAVLQARDDEELVRQKVGKLVVVPCSSKYDSEYDSDI